MECKSIAICTVNYVDLHIIHGSALDIQDGGILVNSAQETLILGGGIAGAIREKAGESIQNECSNWLRNQNKTVMDEGEVAITSAGYLNNFKYIFHTVGPRIHGNVNDRDKEKLVRAIYSCFVEADRMLESKIVIPAISTGIFGYPLMLAAFQHFEAFFLYARNLKKANSTLRNIYLCLYRVEELNDFLVALDNFLVFFDYVKLF